MRLFNIGICAALAVVLLAYAPPAFASRSPFSISGQVIDRYGNPVQGANVTLIDFNYKIIGIRQTGDIGNFDFINVVTDVDTCKVLVSYTDAEGKKYEVRPERVSWYPTKGMQFVSGKETVITDYPPPVYGYIYGAIQTDISTSGRFIDGIVYLASEDVKYYEFAERTDGKGSFMFYTPPGAYVLYAQHRENGVVYESAHKQVTIQPNSDVTEVLETRIILPLNSPSSDPDPAAMPSRHENRVSGTVTAKDGKPLAGATVALYQKADNGTGFLPMRGADSRPLTTVTDSNGYYEFYGVFPTTDDGKSIQAKKDIKAMVEYLLTENLTIWAESKENALYYPDVLLANGLESQARNVTLSGVLSTGDRTQPTVSVSDVPPAAPASNIAAIPLLAALAIGLLCIVGFYLALNRKG